MPPRPLQLIHRYLDGLATPEEEAELERLLREQPAVAELLVRASRLEEQLRSLFQEDRRIAETGIQLQQAVPSPERYLPEVEPAGRPVQRKRRWSWLAAAVVLLALGLGLPLFWLREQQPHPPRLPQGPHQVVAGKVLFRGEPAERLPNGAVIQVSQTGPATLRLADGSTCELEAGTQAVLHGRDVDARQLVELIEGGGTFHVLPGETTFQVLVHDGRVAALATDFTVHLLPDPSQGDQRMRKRNVLLVVAVLAGLVQVDLPGTSYVLGQGDRQAFPGERGEQPGKRALRGIIEELAPDKLVLDLGGDNPRKETVNLPPGIQVFIDGKEGKFGDLLKGMLVTIQQGDNGVIKSVRAEGPRAGGQLKAVDAKARTVTLQGRPREEGGPSPEVTLPVAPDASIIINGKPGTLTELRVGELVAIVAAARDGKTVVNLTQGRGREGGEPGRDRERQAFVRGQVKAIDTKANTITLTIRRDGGVEEEKSYPLAKEVRVITGRDGGKLTDIAAGTTVMLTLSPDRSNVIAVSTQGEREGGRRQVFVRGLVKASDSKAGTITLTIPIDGGDEVEKTYTLAKDARILTGKDGGKLEDIAAGTRVILTLTPDRSRVTSVAVQGVREGGREGERRPTLPGQVKAVDVKAGTITLTTRRGEGGNVVEQTFKLSKELKVTVGREAGQLEQVMPGTQVLLTLSPDRSTVIAISVQVRRGDGERER